jgi:palmitoyltransferase
MGVDILVAHSVELGLASNTPDTTINATTAEDEIITRPPPILTRSWSLPHVSTRALDTLSLPVLARPSSLPITLAGPATDIDSDSSSVWTYAWSDEMPGPATSKRCGTRWIARLLPVFMLILVGYATYDVVVYCCGMHCSPCNPLFSIQANHRQSSTSFDRRGRQQPLSS